MHRVLFVSKPLAPPFHDGAKCLVRDVARHLERFEPIVMSTADAPPIAKHDGRALEAAVAYGDAGRFSPALSANLRAAAWLLFRSRADLWHVVFAPNPRTSQALALLKRLRRKPVVQTVASPPRSFERPARLFFGDSLVAQSEWTRKHVEQAHLAAGLPLPRLVVIPPPVPEVSLPGPADVARERRALAIPEGVPYFVYPGDLETSSGAAATAALLGPLSRELPEAIIVFAYRTKTPRAAVEAARLATQLPPERTRLVADTPKILNLIVGARAVLFPVDDLWGKVDIPIVLLEAMELGIPVLALAQGPLLDLAGVVALEDLSAERWAAAAARLSRDDGERAALIGRQRAALDARHRPRSVARAYEELYLEHLHAHGG